MSGTSKGNGLASVADLFPAGGVKRRYKEVTLPVNGYKVRIQSMSEGELSRYQSAAMNSTGSGTRKARLEDATRRLFVLCLVDQAGNRILGKADIEKFTDWDAADTSFLYDECAAHCGISQRDIEDLVKNSEEMSAAGAPSSSPSE